MAQLRKNRAKQKLSDGGVATAAMGYITSDFIEYMGSSGFDAMWRVTLGMFWSYSDAQF